MSSIKRPRFGGVFLFCPFAIQPHTSVCSAFCDVHAIYTAHAAKQRTGPCKRFSCDLPHSTAYNTRQIKADITPPATRWSTPQSRSASSTYQIPAVTPDAAQASAAAYYNKVYKGADHASPAGSRCFPRLALAWHRISLALAWHYAFSLARRRGTISGYRRISFRAFAR